MDRPLVDPKVFELAQYFLSDTDTGDEASEDREWDLAQVIQMSIEDWFEDSTLQRGGSAAPESQGIEVLGSGTHNSGEANG